MAEVKAKDKGRAREFEWRTFVAGGMAGVVAKTAVNPLERVRILNQVGAAQGLVGTLRTMVQREGLVAGLWAGNFTNCLRVFPNKAILFGCNDRFKVLMEQFLPGFRGNSVLAGSLSGVCTILGTYPLDLARGRISGTLSQESAGGQKKYKGMLRVIYLTYKEEGFKALYRGMPQTIIGSVFYEGIKFGTYDLVNSTLRGFIGGPSLDAVAGAAAGTAAALLTYPNDTIRRRMQLQGTQAQQGGVQYRNALHCFRHMIAHEGFLSLYRGLLVTCIRSVPNTAIQFVAFEQFRKVLVTWI